LTTRGTMITVVVGNRPQFIKLAPVSKFLQSKDIDFEIIHSGQHHDVAMSDTFFGELDLPPPARKLVVTQQSHGGMTSEMLFNVERALLEKRPRGVIVFGDTNTTLSAALAAAKLGIPIAHIEAGPRTDRFDAPEEINRRVTDQLSSLCFCPDNASLNNLLSEGFGARAVWVGDVMFDAFQIFKTHPKCVLGPEIAAFADINQGFALLTVHRAHNTNTLAALVELTSFIESSPIPIAFPVHPRTLAALKQANLLARISNLAHVCLTPPLGYLQMLALIKSCKIVLTDSGGLQKEAFFGGKQSILFDTGSPWPELSDNGWALSIGGFDQGTGHEMANYLTRLPIVTSFLSSFGDGKASERIVKHLGDSGWF
jgi:UDP-GlcNAc3NAcA epimerase